MSAGASQVISNVPAAVLLSHVTDAWQPLLVGVNVGGAGTLVASLASLITFSHFCADRRGFPRRAGLAACTPAKFVALFSAFNFAFLAVLPAGEFPARRLALPMRPTRADGPPGISAAA